MPEMTEKMFAAALPEVIQHKTGKVVEVPVFAVLNDHNQVGKVDTERYPLDKYLAELHDHWKGERTFRIVPAILSLTIPDVEG